MRRSPTFRRRAALSEEVEFWRDWFATGGLPWPEHYRFCTDPDSEVDDPLVRGILASSQQSTVSILDVGAGPITGIGFRYPGKQLAITAVDPLAGEYDWIMREYAIEPPVRTLTLHGEQLPDRFGPASFDLAFARNSLDHTVDPVPVEGALLCCEARTEGTGAFKSMLMSSSPHPCRFQFAATILSQLDVSNAFTRSGVSCG